MNEKGFSLIELIIVIAIMAILVGVIVPNLLRYIERTKLASDIQLADTVRTAMITALLEPDAENPADGNYGWCKFSVTDPVSGYLHEDGSDTPLGRAFAISLGYPDVITMSGPDGLSKQMRVNNSDFVEVVIDHNKVYTVIFDNDSANPYICVPDCSWDHTVSTWTHMH